MGQKCAWPCKLFEIETIKVHKNDVKTEDFVVIATKRVNHFRVVPRKNNKLNFWTAVFDLRAVGNLSLKSLKDFNIENKTFYESTNFMNFEFSDTIKNGDPSEIFIFTEIS
jgi:hypothetical protein